MNYEFGVHCQHFVVKASGVDSLCNCKIPEMHARIIGTAIGKKFCWLSCLL